MRLSVIRHVEPPDFWLAAGEYLKEKRKEEIFYDKQKKDHYMNHMFHGYDMDRTMLRIGAMNMMTHGIENPYIEVSG